MCYLVISVFNLGCSGKDHAFTFKEYLLHKCRFIFIFVQIYQMKGLVSLLYFFISHFSD